MLKAVKKINIVIVDYNMSNIFSVQNIFSHLHVPITISTFAEDITNADALIIPGVGAFGEAMANLRQLQLIEPIKAFIASGKPFFGICLGLQLLFSRSYEFGLHQGLDILEGEVVKFAENGHDRAIKVPNVGWNTLREVNSWKNSPLSNLKNNEFVYFVHSFYVKSKEAKWILTTTQYGDLTYCSSVQKDNIFATQFHPEKSGSVGLTIVKNWIRSLHNGT